MIITVLIENTWWFPEGSWDAIPTRLLRRIWAKLQKRYANPNLYLSVLS